MLSIAVLSTLLLTAGQAIGLWQDRARLAADARAVSTLAEEVRLWLDADTTRLPTGTAPQAISLDDLETDGVRPLGAPATTPGTRRAMSAFTWTDAPNRVLILARARGDIAPSESLGPSISRAGIVISRDDGLWLVGPGVRLDMDPLNATVTDIAEVGDIFALAHVFTNLACEAYLHRDVLPGCPDATTLATDLDLGGNAILNAGTITANEIALRTITSDVTVSDAVTVEDQLTVRGGAVLRGTLAVDGQSVFADTMTITGDLSAVDVAASGSLTGSDLTFTGDIAVGGNAVLGTASATSLVADTIVTNELYGDTGRFDTLIVEDLTVSGCTGC